MNNQAIRGLCAGMITLGILCGGVNVSAKSMETDVEISAPLHVDAGIVTYLRDVRGNAETIAMVSKHNTDMVQSSGVEVTTDVKPIVIEPVIEASYEVIKEFPITDGNTTKSVLPYTAFGENTNQKRLQSLCETNEVGLRMYDGRYTIAVGTYFDTIVGQYFDLILENGTVIPCIMGDLKADIHTDARGLFTEASGCMTEFIVDQTYLPNKCSATYCYDNWNSKVVNVIVYNKFVDLDL